MSKHTAITETEADRQMSEILDRRTEITRAVALIHQCPEWVEHRRKCDDPTPCFCRQAAEAVAKIVAGDLAPAAVAKVTWTKDVPLNDPRVVNYLHSASAPPNRKHRIYVHPADVRSKQAHFLLQRDRNGFYIRSGRRHATEKKYLSSCDIISQDGETQFEFRVS